MLRYKMFRFLSRIGFRPPYLYNRTLRDRLYRCGCPALVLWGAEDRLVPTTHAMVYGDELGDARVEILSSAGHSFWIEQPDDTADLVRSFLLD